MADIFFRQTWCTSYMTVLADLSPLNIHNIPVPVTNVLLTNLISLFRLLKVSLVGFPFTCKYSVGFTKISSTTSPMKSRRSVTEVPESRE